MRILIADDSTTPRLVHKRLLERLGHECIVAVDGRDAWRKFECSRPDVVISDRMMPGMDGDELCRRVRGHPTAPYAYFILVTRWTSTATSWRACRPAPTTTCPSRSTSISSPPA